MPEPRNELSVSLPESSVLSELELERAYAEAAGEEEQFRAFESSSADGLEDHSAW
jgi:hypothetical protein